MSIRDLLMAASGATPPALPGQVEYTAVGTYSWTVPANVFSICMVAIQPGGQTAPTTVTAASVIVCRAQNGARIGDGGGDGAPGGASGSYDTYIGGGGGAGKYTGNGATSSQIASSSFDQEGIPGVGSGLKGVGSVGSFGSGAPGEQHGGVSPYVWSGLSGGALSYKNDVPVIPGSTVTVVIPAAGSNYLAASGAGGVRIIWGSGRTYPSTNTGDM